MIRKKNKTKKAFAALLAMLVLSVIFCGCIGEEKETPAPTTAAPTTTPPAEVEPIRIGVSHPFTGAASYLGDSMKKGIILAVEEINEEGGVLGRPIRLFWGDDKCDPAEGPKSIQKLISVDNVDAILAPACSSVVLAIMPIINEEEIPMLVMNATNPKITEYSGVGGNPWVFRENPMDFAMGPSFVNTWIEEIGITSISILALNNDFGRGNAEVYSKLCEEFRVEVKSIDYFQYGDTEFTPVLTKIKNLDPDGLFITADVQEGYNIIKQFRELKMRQTLLGRGEIASLHFMEVAGEELAEGMYGVNFYSIGIDTPEHNDFKLRFKVRWGHNVDLTAAWGYVGAHVMAAAIEKAGSTDKEAIKAALETLVYDSVLGRIEFDDHHQSWGNAYILVLTGGEEVLKYTVSTLPYSELYYESIED